MDVTRSGPIALAESRIRWLEMRQRVLAQNVANADTPGFRPIDLRPFADTLAALVPGLRLTHPRHRAAATDPRLRPERQGVERSMDGNAVALDREALRIADTDTAHALAVALHRRYLGLFRLALGRTP